MKRILGILLFSALLSQVAISQDETTEAKVSTGRYSVDVNFNPAAFFDAAAGDMFVSPLIKGRYFLATDLAVRAGLNIGFGSTKTYPNPANDDYNTTSSFSFTIAPGIEKQFGSKRFFAIVGAELPISSMSSASEVNTGGTIVKNENVAGGYFKVGVNAVFGFDFYVLPNLFIGAEFTPGFALTSNKDVIENDIITTKGGKSTSFGLNSTSGLKIGVRF